MKHIIVDASVVLKWYLVDEDLSDKALKEFIQNNMNNLGSFVTTWR